MQRRIIIIGRKTKIKCRYIADFVIKYCEFLRGTNVKDKNKKLRTYNIWFRF